METSVAYPKIPKKLSKGARDWSGSNANWVIQEKVDGSQLTFYVDSNNTLHFFNRGKEKVAPFPRVFERTAISLEKIKSRLEPGLVYHGEAMQKRKHNVLVYDRVPRYCFVLFDIQRNGQYATHNEMKQEAHRVGLEHVPALHTNTSDTDALDPLVLADIFVSVNKTPSVLGDYAEDLGYVPPVTSFLGGRIEGVVIKHPTYVNKKGKKVATKVKVVCAQFQEEHQKGGIRFEQSTDELIEQLLTWFSQEAWWRKAMFRLRDNNVIDLSERDEKRRLRDGATVGQEVKRDFEEEEKEFVKEQLWQIFRARILKHMASGCSQWYARYNDPIIIDETGHALDMIKEMRAGK